MDTFYTYYYAISDLLGITGNRGSPRLEVCPRLPVHSLVCVLACRHLQMHTHTHPHPPPPTHNPTHTHTQKGGTLFNMNLPKCGLKTKYSQRGADPAILLGAQRLFKKKSARHPCTVRHHVSAKVRGMHPCLYKNKEGVQAEDPPKFAAGQFASLPDSSVVLRIGLLAFPSPILV